MPTISNPTWIGVGTLKGFYSTEKWSKEEDLMENLLKILFDLNRNRFAPDDGIKISKKAYKEKFDQLIKLGLVKDEIDFDKFFKKIEKYWQRIYIEIIE